MRIFKLRCRNGCAKPTVFPTIYKSATILCVSLFMPYIKGPRMDWMMNDSLYHRFLKWKLKCENILHCELAMLPESKKCKRVIVWNEDLEGINMCHGACPQKISAWKLFRPSMKIFASHRPMKFEPDLTCWQASDKAISQLMSGTMWLKLKLPSTH